MIETEANQARTAGPCPPAAGSRRRWVLALIEDRDAATALKQALHRPDRPVRAVMLDEEGSAVGPVADGERAADGRGPDVVISAAEATSWRTIALLSSLRQRLPREDINVLLVSDVADELLPVHVTDFPGLRRIALGSDIAGATTLLLGA